MAAGTPGASRHETAPGAAMRGDAPRPSNTETPPKLPHIEAAKDAKEETMTKVLKYDNVLTARVSDADFRAVCERADDEGLTRSEYLRYVVRMVADDPENAKRGGVLLDGLSMRKLSRELVKWGHHYNQGVHALNSIKFALDHGRGDLEWVSGKLDECALLLAQVEDGRGELSRKISGLAQHAIVGGD